MRTVLFSALLSFTAYAQTPAKIEQALDLINSRLKNVSSYCASKGWEPAIIKVCQDRLSAILLERSEGLFLRLTDSTINQIIVEPVGSGGGVGGQ